MCGDMMEAHGIFPEQVMELTFVDLWLMNGKKEQKGSGGDLESLWTWWAKATPDDIYKRAIGE